MLVVGNAQSQPPGCTQPAVCDEISDENCHTAAFRETCPILCNACTIPGTPPPTFLSRSPTTEPSVFPISTQPTAFPTRLPTQTPTPVPTVRPSRLPTKQPTLPPSVTPTQLPSPHPSPSPSAVPTEPPTPSWSPTTDPTGSPTGTEGCPAGFRVRWELLEPNCTSEAEGCYPPECTLCFGEIGSENRVLLSSASVAPLPRPPASATWPRLGYPQPTPPHARRLAD